jgi:hypothetical protein
MPGKQKKSSKTTETEIEEGEETQKRSSRPGYRHRKNNGPAEYQIEPVQAPDPRDLGTLTRYTREVIQGGPRALIAARHRAAELAQKFGEEIEAQWCLLTPWLKELSSEQRFDGLGRNQDEINRRRVRYALCWRPRYLAALALSGGAQLAARAAKVSVFVVRDHRKHDPDFELQCQEAEAHFVELLHDVTMQSAIEGECEPIVWQGVVCGHIRKVDNRLRIEILRAKMPQTFKTPGNKVEINTGPQQNNMFICGPEQQDRLIAMRRESLQKMADQKAKALAMAPITITAQP